MFSKERYQYFQELATVNYPFFFWEYTPDMELLNSNCPFSEYANQLLTLNGGRSYLCQQAAQNSTLPLILSDVFEVLWAAVFSTAVDGSVDGILLMGPVLANDYSLQQFSSKLDQYALSVSMRRQIHDFFYSLPMVPGPVFYQYVLMLHRCIRQETLTFRHILQKTLFDDTPSPKDDFENQKKKLRDMTSQCTPMSTDAQKLSSNFIYQQEDVFTSTDHSGIVSFENELNLVIEQGNLGALDIVSKGAILSGGVRAVQHNSLQRARYNCIIFITICSRAAIRGGLSPDISYSLCDLYTNAVDGCQSVNDIKNLNDAILHDFVSRVHEHRKNPNISAPIATCIDYISMHVKDPIEAETLADLTGYKVYYLTKKFKNETGMSLNQYIQKEKIAYARILLSSTGNSITDISEALSYHSQSYFSKTFQKETGMSPTEYRLQSYGSATAIPSKS